MRIPPVIAPTTLRAGTPTKLRAATVASERSPIPAAANARQHADQHVPRPDPVVGAKGQAAGQHQERGDEEGGIDQRAQDIEVRNEGPGQVQALGQAHEAPGQQQVVEEPRAVERIQVGEDQELQRQGERRRKRQRGCHGHGHNAPQVILPAYVNLHANATPRIDWHRRTTATFRAGTSRSDVKRQTAMRLHGRRPGPAPGSWTKVH